MNKTNTSPAATSPITSDTDREIKVVTVPEGPRDLADAILEANKDQAKEDGKSVHDRRAARKQASARALKPVTEIAMFSRGERNLHHELGHFPSEAEAKKAATSNEGVVIDNRWYKDAEGNRVWPLETVLGRIRKTGSDRALRAAAAPEHLGRVVQCSKSGLKDTQSRPADFGKRQFWSNFFVPGFDVLQQQAGDREITTEDVTSAIVHWTQLPANAGQKDSGWYNVGSAIGMLEKHNRWQSGKRRAEQKEQERLDRVAAAEDSGDVIISCSRNPEVKDVLSFETEVEKDGDSKVIVVCPWWTKTRAGDFERATGRMPTLEQLATQAVHVSELTHAERNARHGDDRSWYRLDSEVRFADGAEGRAKQARRRNGGAFGKQQQSTVEADEESLAQAYLDGNFRPDPQTIKAWIKDGEITNEMLATANSSVVAMLLVDDLVKYDEANQPVLVEQN